MSDLLGSIGGGASLGAKGEDRDLLENAVEGILLLLEGDFVVQLRRRSGGRVRHSRIGVRWVHIQIDVNGPIRNMAKLVKSNDATKERTRLRRGCGEIESNKEDQLSVRVGRHDDQLGIVVDGRLRNRGSARSLCWRSAFIAARRLHGTVTAIRPLRVSE